jgi:hypothetical protein
MIALTQTANQADLYQVVDLIPVVQYQCSSQDWIVTFIQPLHNANSPVDDFHNMVAGNTNLLSSHLAASLDSKSTTSRARGTLIPRYNTEERY